MPVFKDCKVSFTASVSRCNSRLLIVNINTSKQLSFGVCWRFKAALCVALAIVNASRFCTLAAACCALFVQGLFHPRKQVVHTFEKSSVCAVAGLKARFMSLFIWEEASSQLSRLVCPSWAQTLCSGVSRGTLFSLCSLWSVHSCDERDLGLLRARHDVYNIHFSGDQD